MTLRRFIVVVVLGLVAMRAKGARHEEEFQVVHARVARGDATAQNQLEVMYHQGQGIPQK